LEIRSITGAGGSGWKLGETPSCVELGKDAKKTIVVQTRIGGDWLLRPLGFCEKDAQCGFIEASVSDIAGNVLLSQTAATTAIELPFAGLAEPEGTRLFKVRLLHDDGTEFFIGDGGTVCEALDDCAISVEIRSNCGGAPNDDGGSPEAGSNDLDAGRLDGAADATTPDATTPDATTPDATFDASTAPDGGALDASRIDASLQDASGDAAVN
jgi:hypothetical protein